MADVSSSSTLRDTLIYLKKKLERTTDEEAVLRIIHKLSKVPITIDLLQGTGAGKIMRSLAKKSGTVGVKASSVLNKWREVVVNSQKSNENLKQNLQTKSNFNDENGSGSEISLSSKHTKHEKYSKNQPEKSFRDKHCKEKHSKEKHAKEKHSRDKHSKNKYFEEQYPKEKPLKSYCKDVVHQEERDSSKYKTVKKSGEKIKDENPKEMYLLQTNKNFTSKYISNIIYEHLDSNDSNYNPDHPDIYLKNKGKSNRESDTVPCAVTYEPSPKRVHLSASDSSKLSSDSNILMDSSHKKKHTKDSKASIKKNICLVEKSVESDNEILKTKMKKSSSHLAKKLFKKSLQIKNTEVLTSSEATFEDCLSLNDIPIKKKKSSKLISNPTKKPKECSKKASNNQVQQKPCMMVKPIMKIDQIADFKISEETLQKPNFRNMEVDINSTLPQIVLNYRPLPQRNFDSSPTKKKVMSNEEAIKYTSSRREKTAVYSGRKNCYLTEVPTLFDCCTKVLIDNIDDIEYMGGIPFFLLEQMLQKCTAAQLDRIEHYNPYLLEDTNELWEKHCKRDYRSSKPQENETWRELYWRSFDDQAKKLKSVTANITASIANSNPVRKAKLAYIDAVVKPPREVARRQAKNGTALPTSHTVKAAPPSKSSPVPVTLVINSASTSKSRVECKPQKPKVAPLMAKTLKSMKQCFRR